MEAHEERGQDQVRRPMRGMDRHGTYTISSVVRLSCMVLSVFPSSPILVQLYDWLDGYVSRLVTWKFSQFVDKSI